ncbi:MAG: hypothetical protein U0838_14580 [Chloroflexota bacterium]
MIRASPGRRAAARIPGSTSQGRAPGAALIVADDGTLEGTTGDDAADRSS